MPEMPEGLAPLSLAGYSALSGLVAQLDAYLKRKYPDFFGASSSHPYFPLKHSKVIHDNLWGTNHFEWQELILIDSPLFQRLRDIHQVGLAFQVYPSAQHSRFEHSLGVVTIASRIFDALMERHRGEAQDIAASVAPAENPSRTLRRWKRELRLAALLHDTGHSAFSHSSERVYENLGVLSGACEELSRFVGKRKGAGEVLSFCLANTRCVAQLLARAEERLVGGGPPLSEDGGLDLGNVALILVGRSRHPFLQFLGDIVSSGFDADKLDYLLRDAGAAGLPLRYDLDRYLYSVRLAKETIVDPEGELKKLYGSCVGPGPELRRPTAAIKFPHFETYRLRLPRQAMNTIEQIVICKLMLFSYVYHHPKVRAAEGMLVKVLEQMVRSWRDEGQPDQQILEHFLDMTDSVLIGGPTGAGGAALSENYLYRLRNRLLPREVYSLSGDVATHAERPLLTDFLTSLQDRDRRQSVISELEGAIGQELAKLENSATVSPEEALAAAGVWVDVPKAPEFEDIHELVVAGASAAPGVPLLEVFPIGEWTQAYAHFRYRVRIFAFSEAVARVERAAKSAMQKIIRIRADSFYERVRRARA
jgi:uncharacterized protein